MLSRRLARLRRGAAARAPRAALLAPLALVTAALLLPACTTYEHHEQLDPASRPPATREAARGLAYTSTSEIRFGDDLVGYLVEVQPVPGGVVDVRPWEPGDAIIQDDKFEFVGFISQHNTTYRFDQDGLAQPVGVALGSGRNAGIAAFFRRNGDPKLVPVLVGT